MVMAAKGLYVFHAAASATAGVVAPAALSDRFLEAFGIHDGPTFVAGMAFALAGGFVAMAISPPSERLDKWLTLLVAVLVGVLAAVLHRHVPVIDELPAQAVMGIAGLGSRKAVDRIRNHDLTLPWKETPK